MIVTTNAELGRCSYQETLYQLQQKTIRLIKEQWRSLGWSEEMSSSNGRKVKVIHPVLPGKCDVTASSMYFIIGKSYILYVYWGDPNTENIILFRSNRPLSRNYSYAKLASLRYIDSLGTFKSISYAVLAVLKQLPRWTLVVGHSKPISLESVFDLACEAKWKCEDMVRFLEVAKIQGFTNKDDISKFSASYKAKNLPMFNIFQDAINAKTKRKPYTHAFE